MSRDLSCKEQMPEEDKPPSRVSGIYGTAGMPSTSNSNSPVSGLKYPNIVKPQASRLVYTPGLLSSMELYPGPSSSTGIARPIPTGSPVVTPATLVAAQNEMRARSDYMARDQRIQEMRRKFEEEQLKQQADKDLEDRIRRSQAAASALSGSHIQRPTPTMGGSPFSNAGILHHPQAIHGSTIASPRLNAPSISSSHIQGVHDSNATVRSVARANVGFPPTSEPAVKQIVRGGGQVTAPYVPSRARTVQPPSQPQTPALQQPQITRPIPRTAAELAAEVAQQERQRQADAAAQARQAVLNEVQRQEQQRQQQQLAHEMLRNVHRSLDSLGQMQNRSHLEGLPAPQPRIPSRQTIGGLGQGGSMLSALTAQLQAQQEAALRQQHQQQQVMTSGPASHLPHNRQYSGGYPSSATPNLVNRNPPIQQPVRAMSVTPSSISAAMMTAAAAAQAQQQQQLQQHQLPTSFAEHLSMQLGIQSSPFGRATGGMFAPQQIQAPQLSQGVPVIQTAPAFGTNNSPVPPSTPTIGLATPSPRPSILRRKGDPGSAAKRRLGFDENPQTLGAYATNQLVTGAITTEMRRKDLEKPQDSAESSMSNNEETPRKRMRKQQFDANQAPDQIRMQISEPDPEQLAFHINSFSLNFQSQGKMLVHPEKRKRGRPSALQKEAQAFALQQLAASTTTTSVIVDLDQPSTPAKKSSPKKAQQQISPVVTMASRKALPPSKEKPEQQPKASTSTDSPKTPRPKRLSKREREAEREKEMEQERDQEQEMEKETTAAMVLECRRSRNPVNRMMMTSSLFRAASEGLSELTREKLKKKVVVKKKRNPAIQEMLTLERRLRVEREKKRRLELRRRILLRKRMLERDLEAEAKKVLRTAPPLKRCPVEEELETPTMKKKGKNGAKTSPPEPPRRLPLIKVPQLSQILEVVAKKGLLEEKPSTSAESPDVVSENVTLTTKAKDRAAAMAKKKFNLLKKLIKQGKRKLLGKKKTEDEDIEVVGERKQGEDLVHEKENNSSIAKRSRMITESKKGKARTGMIRNKKMTLKKRRRPLSDEAKTTLLKQTRRLRVLLPRNIRGNQSRITEKQKQLLIKKNLLRKALKSLRTSKNLTGGNVKRKIKLGRLVFEPSFHDLRAKRMYKTNHATKKRQTEQDIISVTTIDEKSGHSTATEVQESHMTVKVTVSTQGTMKEVDASVLSAAEEKMMKLMNAQRAMLDPLPPPPQHQSTSGIEMDTTEEAPMLDEDEKDSDKDSAKTTLKKAAAKMLKGVEHTGSMKIALPTADINKTLERRYRFMQPSTSRADEAYANVEDDLIKEFQKAKSQETLLDEKRKRLTELLGKRRDTLRKMKQKVAKLGVPLGNAIEPMEMQEVEKQKISNGKAGEKRDEIQPVAAMNDIKRKSKMTIEHEKVTDDSPVDNVKECASSEKPKINGYDKTTKNLKDTIKKGKKETDVHIVAEVFDLTKENEIPCNKLALKKNGKTVTAVKKTTSRTPSFPPNTTLSNTTTKANTPKSAARALFQSPTTLSTQNNDEKTPSQTPILAFVKTPKKKMKKLDEQIKSKASEVHTPKKIVKLRAFRAALKKLTPKEKQMVLNVRRKFRVRFHKILVRQARTVGSVRRQAVRWGKMKRKAHRSRWEKGEGKNKKMAKAKKLKRRRTKDVATRKVVLVFGVPFVVIKKKEKDSKKTIKKLYPLVRTQKRIRQRQRVLTRIRRKTLKRLRNRAIRRKRYEGNKGLRRAVARFRREEAVRDALQRREDEISLAEPIEDAHTKEDQVIGFLTKCMKINRQQAFVEKKMSELDRKCTAPPPDVFGRTSPIMFFRREPNTRSILGDYTINYNARECLEQPQTARGRVHFESQKLLHIQHERIMDERQRKCNEVAEIMMAERFPLVELPCPAYNKQEEIKRKMFNEYNEEKRKILLEIYDRFYDERGYAKSCYHRENRIDPEIEEMVMGRKEHRRRNEKSSRRWKSKSKDSARNEKSKQTKATREIIRGKRKRRGYRVTNKEKKNLLALRIAMILKRAHALEVNDNVKEEDVVLVDDEEQPTMEKEVTDEEQALRKVHHRIGRMIEKRKKSSRKRDVIPTLDVLLKLHPLKNPTTGKNFESVDEYMAYVEETAETERLKAGLGKIVTNVSKRLSEESLKNEGPTKKKRKSVLKRRRKRRMPIIKRLSPLVERRRPNKQLNHIKELRKMISEKGGIFAVLEEKQERKPDVCLHGLRKIMKEHHRPKLPDITKNIRRMMRDKSGWRRSEAIGLKKTTLQCPDLMSGPPTDFAGRFRYMMKYGRAYIRQKEMRKFRVEMQRQKNVKSLQRLVAPQKFKVQEKKETETEKAVAKKLSNKAVVDLRLRRRLALRKKIIANVQRRMKRTRTKLLRRQRKFLLKHGQTPISQLKTLLPILSEETVAVLENCVEKKAQSPEKIHHESSPEKPTSLPNHINEREDSTSPSPRRPARLLSDRLKNMTPEMLENLKTKHGRPANSKKPVDYVMLEASRTPEPSNEAAAALQQIAPPPAVTPPRPSAIALSETIQPVNDTQHLVEESTISEVEAPPRPLTLAQKKQNFLSQEASDKQKEEEEKTKKVTPRMRKAAARLKLAQEGEKYVSKIQWQQRLKILVRRIMCAFTRPRAVRILLNIAPRIKMRKKTMLDVIEMLEEEEDNARHGQCGNEYVELRTMGMNRMCRYFFPEFAKYSNSTNLKKETLPDEVIVEDLLDEMVTFVSAHVDEGTLLSKLRMPTEPAMELPAIISIPKENKQPVFLPRKYLRVDRNIAFDLGMEVYREAGHKQVIVEVAAETKDRWGRDHFTLKMLQPKSFVGRKEKTVTMEPVELDDDDESGRRSRKQTKDEGEDVIVDVTGDEDEVMDVEPTEDVIPESSTEATESGEEGRVKENEAALVSYECKSDEPSTSRAGSSTENCRPTSSKGPNPSPDSSVLDTLMNMQAIEDDHHRVAQLSSSNHHEKHYKLIRKPIGTVYDLSASGQLERFMNETFHIDPKTLVGRKLLDKVFAKGPGSVAVEQFVYMRNESGKMMIEPRLAVKYTDRHGNERRQTLASFKQIEGKMWEGMQQLVAAAASENSGADAETAKNECEGDDREIKKENYCNNGSLNSNGEEEDNEYFLQAIQFNEHGNELEEEDDEEDVKDLDTVVIVNKKLLHKQQRMVERTRLFTDLEYRHRTRILTGMKVSFGNKECDEFWKKRKCTNPKPSRKSMDPLDLPVKYQVKFPGPRFTRNVLRRRALVQSVKVARWERMQKEELVTKSEYEKNVNRYRNRLVEQLTSEKEMRAQNVRNEAKKLAGVKKSSGKKVSRGLEDKKKISDNSKTAIVKRKRKLTREVENNSAKNAKVQIISEGKIDKKISVKRKGGMISNIVKEKNELNKGMTKHEKLVKGKNDLSKATVAKRELAQMKTTAEEEKPAEGVIEKNTELVKALLSGNEQQEEPQIVEEFSNDDEGLKMEKSPEKEMTALLKEKDKTIRKPEKENFLKKRITRNVVRKKGINARKKGKTVKKGVGKVIYIDGEKYIVRRKRTRTTSTTVNKVLLSPEKRKVASDITPNEKKSLTLTKRMENREQKTIRRNPRVLCKMSKSNRAFIAAKVAKKKQDINMAISKKLQNGMPKTKITARLITRWIKRRLANKSQRKRMARKRMIRYYRDIDMEKAQRRKRKLTVSYEGLSMKRRREMDVIENEDIYEAHQTALQMKEERKHRTRRLCQIRKFVKNLKMRKKKSRLQEAYERISRELNEVETNEERLCDDFMRLLGAMDVPRYNEMLDMLEMDEDQADTKCEARRKRIARIRSIIIAVPGADIKLKPIPFGDNCSTVVFAPSNEAIAQVLGPLATSLRGKKRRCNRLKPGPIQPPARPPNSNLPEEPEELFVEDLENFYHHQDRDLLRTQLKARMEECMRKERTFLEHRKEFALVCDITNRRDTKPGENWPEPQKSPTQPHATATPQQLEESPEKKKRGRKRKRPLSPPPKEPTPPPPKKNKLLPDVNMGNDKLLTLRRRIDPHFDDIVERRMCRIKEMFATVVNTLHQSYILLRAMKEILLKWKVERRHQLRKKMLKRRRLLRKKRNLRMKNIKRGRKAKMALKKLKGKNMQKKTHVRGKKGDGDKKTVAMSTNQKAANTKMTANAQAPPPPSPSPQKKIATATPAAAARSSRKPYNRTGIKRGPYKKKNQLDTTPRRRGRAPTTGPRRRTNNNTSPSLSPPPPTSARRPGADRKARRPTTKERTVKFEFYDEEEQIRLAIEESLKDLPADVPSTSRACFL